MAELKLIRIVLKLAKRLTTRHKLKQNNDTYIPTQPFIIFVVQQQFRLTHELGVSVVRFVNA